MKANVFGITHEIIEKAANLLKQIPNDQFDKQKFEEKDQKLVLDFNDSQRECLDTCNLIKMAAK